MIRDGIDLVTLSAMGVANGADGAGFYSVVALVAEYRPLCWGKQRRDNRLVEYLEFFLSDDTESLYKVRAWGEAAVHVAARLEAQSVFLFDRLEARSTAGQHKPQGTERYGVFSRSHTSMHLLCSPPAALLVPTTRYPQIGRRVNAVLASKRGSTWCVRRDYIAAHDPCFLQLLTVSFDMQLEKCACDSVLPHV